MLTKRQNVHRTYRVAWGSGSAVRAVIDPAVPAPLPTYGTRLRGKGFAEGHHPSRLVIQLLDELARAGRADLLRLHASAPLCGLVERLTHLARHTRERAGNRVCGPVCGPVCGLVCQIADAPRRLAQQARLAPLQPPVAARALGALRLACAQAGELLVAVLDGGFGSTAADQDHLLAVSGSCKRIDAQVHADYGLLRAWLVRDLADQAHDSIRQAHRHQATRQGDRVGQADTQGAAPTVGQDQSPIADSSVLVGVHTTS
jgi:hypothetical protein